MESLAAFGLAVNVIQVIDFAGTLLSTSSQIYRAGSSVQSAELEVVVKDFTVLSNRLRAKALPGVNVHGPLSQDDQGIEDLVAESDKIAQELISVLSSARLKGRASKYKSFVQAIKTTWNSAKIEETTKRLEAIRAQLQFRMIATISDGNLQQLDKISRRNIECFRETKQDLETTLKALADRFDEQQEALQRHNELLGSISRTGNGSLEIIPEVVLHDLKAALHFQQIDDRFDDIDDAHRRTFEWAFQDQNSQDRPWPSIPEWLEQGSGVYWISGKAASGKSTLMKCLNQDPRLEEALRAWAQDRTLIIVQFYFWSTGSELQKSQGGLLRSILFQVLEQAPSLAPRLFPDQHRFGVKGTSFPTFHDLKRAFRRLTSEDSNSVRIFMLIDGLDEFDAASLTMAELADTFIQTTKSKTFKAFLSSRPLVAFEAAFAHRPKLRLHELTHNDIKSYVSDKLTSHSRMVDLSVDNPSGTQRLVTEVVDSASGVFLWVKLVVRSLLEGLENYDGLSGLHERLQVLPRDLEDLFRHILHSIPPEYRVQSSRIFQIVRCAHQERILLTGLGLSFAESAIETVVNASITPLSREQKRRRGKEAEGRLRSRCRGLLELRSPEGDGSSIPPDVPLRVEYSHKSVADFLEAEDVWHEILNWTCESRFDPYLALLRCSIMVIKSLDTTSIDFTQRLLDLIEHAMNLARLSEQCSKLAAPKLLGELDKAMASHFQAVPDDEKYQLKSLGINYWNDARTERQEMVQWDESFLVFAVRHGLTLYLQNRIKELGPQCIKREGRPLLEYAFKPIIRNSNPTVQPDLVLILLQHGADPNRKFHRISPWQILLQYIRHFTDRSGPAPWLATVRHLIAYGADPKAIIRETTRNGTPIQCTCLNMLRNPPFSPLLDEISPKDWEKLDELCGLLERKGAKDKEWAVPKNGIKKAKHSRAS